MNFLKYLSKHILLKVQTIYTSYVQKDKNTTLPILSYPFGFLYFFLALRYLFMSRCNILFCSLKHTWLTYM